MNWLKRYWHLQKRSIALLLCLMLVFTVIPIHIVLAQIQEPDSTFQIDQLEAYRHAGEIDSQLYLISYTCEYSMTPSIAIDDTFIFRLMSGNVTLGTTTAYGFHDSGYDSGIAALYFSAADAPAWSGAYKVEFAGNPTLHWLDTTATASMEGAYAAANVTTTDETTESNSAAADDMTLLTASPSVDDAYYFGSDGMFDILTIFVSQQGDWTGTYTWEYWDGDEWAAVSGVNDTSAGFTAGTGNFDITFDCPTDWQKNTVGTTNAYWLRFRVVTYTAIVTQPLGQQSWVNTMDDPPSTESSSFSLWFDESSITETEDRLTTRLRTLATILENDWGILVDLIITTASGKKLTPSGEDYFVTTIPNLRDICPELFEARLETPDFPEDIIVEDNYMGGDNITDDIFLVNWLAQTWTTSAEYYINGVWIKAFRVGLPGDLTVSITETVGGVPVAAGADLAVGTIDADEFTADTDGEWYEITFTDHYQLTFDTEYAITMRVLAGGAANYVSWRLDPTGEEPDGQACDSANSGVNWAALAGTQDFMFGTTGTDVLSMSLRDRLAQRLVGGRLDMTALATYLNTTRMWVSSSIFFAICIAVAVAACGAARSYKPATLIIAFLMPFGSLVGFLYLEISILLAMMFGAVSVFILFHRGATA